MTEGRLVKVRIGMRAKGSCKETKKCFLSFSLVRAATGDGG